MPIDVPFATPGCLRTTCSRGCRAKPGREPDYNPVNGTDSLPSARDPATEVLQLRVAVPKTGQKNALLREDATEAPVGRVAVPKTVHKPPLPREDATEVPVGRVPVPKTFR